MHRATNGAVTEGAAVRELGTELLRTEVEQSERTFPALFLHPEGLVPPHSGAQHCLPSFVQTPSLCALRAKEQRAFDYLPSDRMLLFERDGG